MAAPTSIRFPDDLRARVEGAAIGREKFSATVIRLVEEALSAPPTAEEARRYVERLEPQRQALTAEERPFRPDFGSKLSK